MGGARGPLWTSHKPAGMLTNAAGDRIQVVRYR
jgi:hypothetical protein